VVATQKGCAKGLLFCRQNNTDNMSEYQFADWLKTHAKTKTIMEKLERSFENEQEEIKCITKAVN
jgi:hypothetical protein